MEEAMNWYWLRPDLDEMFVDDGRRTLVAAMAVPETLIDSVRAHLSGLDIKWIEELLDEFFMDGGGMAFIDAPKMALEIEGVKIETYASHVNALFDTLDDLEPATEDMGVEYFLVSGFHRKLLLTRPLLAELQQAMLPLLPEADALATIEDEQRRRLAEDVNKDGVRVLINTTPRGSGELGEA